VVVAAVALGITGGQVVGAAGVTTGKSGAPVHNPAPVVRNTAGADVGIAHPQIFSEPPVGPAPAPETSLGVPPSGPPAFVTPTTEAQVAQDLIAAVDAQSNGVYTIAATADNLSLIESWMANEGGLWADNPLNTSLGTGRYPHQITSGGQDTGIPIFPDIVVGIDATAKTLLSNGAYATILAVLDRGDAPCGAFASAVIDSPWASSHYGHDPARFCGSTAGTGAVPSTTACLRLPDHGKRSALRAAREPGTCGRFATPARHSSFHQVGTDHPATSHRPSGEGGTRHGRSRQRAGLHSAPEAARGLRSSPHVAPVHGVVHGTGHASRGRGGRLR